MQKKIHLGIKQALPILLTFLMPFAINARELSGQVIADDGMTLAGAYINVMRDNWSGEILRSKLLDDTGAFTIECEGSCWVKATQESPTTTRGISNIFQVPGDITVVRLRLSPERTITVKAAVPEKGVFTIKYVNLDTLDEISGGTPFQSNLNYDFKQKVPAGRYRVILSVPTNPAPEKPYFRSVGIDVKNASATVELTPKPFPGDRKNSRTPPNSSLISVSGPDENGRAKVIGASGAADGLMLVGIMNMQTGGMSYGSSAADGSFSVSTFAPIGSSLMVMQTPDAWVYKYNFSHAPGTVVYSNPNDSLAINTSQRLNGRSRNSNPTQFDKIGGTDAGFAWITGRLNAKKWSAGNTGLLTGTGVVYSRNIKDSAPALANGGAYLEMIFDGNGRQTAAGPENTSSDMTPSGLPIDRSEPIYQETIQIGSLKLSDLEITSDATAKFSWSLDYTVPANTPDGIYNLILTGQGWSMNPLVTGLDKDTLYFEDVYGEPSFHLSTVQAAAQISVGQPKNLKLFSSLLLNEFSNGSRGLVSNEDKAKFGISGHIITNSDRFILSPHIEKSKEERTYNLEPFIPLTGYSNKTWMGPPKTLFRFPSGNLTISIVYPDGTEKTLGSDTFKGAYIQKSTSYIGGDWSVNSNAPDTHFGLTTLNDAFSTSFQQYGKHIVSLSGTIDDIYGNAYEITGNYDVYVAESLDLEFGTFPSTPFEVGDTFAPSVIVQPGVPADIEIKVEHLPNSDSSQKRSKVYSGKTNRFGYFMPEMNDVFKFQKPGEYRVDYSASYKDANEVLWMGSRSWGSIVETPDSLIVTHGRRGSESDAEKRQWYNMEDTNSDQNAHFFLPYQTGDISWMENSTSWNAAMTNVVTLEDQSGSIASLGRQQRHLDEGQMYLKSSSEFSSIPPFIVPDQETNHWGYYYSGIGRPGVSVREFVGTEQSSNGYWRFDTPYNFQLGNGANGDLVNDFKFMFGGAVYRAPASDFSYYGAYGSLWVMLPEDDQIGGRIMPPFQGAAGGPSGGPIMKLKEKEIDIFFHPQGVRPGSILEIGDTASFSGQIAPTLPSDISLTIVSPSGSRRAISGRANKVGYYYDPSTDFKIEEAGIYEVYVQASHSGSTSAGNVEAPFPTGGILGGTGDKYYFYAVTKESKTARLKTPQISKLPNSYELNFQLETKSNNPMTSLHQTTVMPGFLLEHNNASEMNYTYNAATLNADFPNLDLRSGREISSNGSDTVTFSFLLSGRDAEGETVYEGRQVLLQGEDLYLIDNELALEGSMNLSMDNRSLSAGDKLKADLSFSGEGLADVYVALVMPDGNFLTIGSPLVVSGVGEVIPFKQSVPFSSKSMNIVDITLPEGVASGTYQFYAIAVDEDESLFDEKNWEDTKAVNWTFQ